MEQGSARRSNSQPTGARPPKTLGLALTTAILVIMAMATSSAWAVENEDCLDCHDDFPSSSFGKSMHGDLDCIDCHEDADVEELPHEEDMSPVYCGNCHDDAQIDYDSSIHGQAAKRNARYAPECWDCHGSHDIESPENPAAKTFKMSVPMLCGECHREGAPVARTYKISEHNIIDNYSQSIHGEGLFKKGLTVTATCNDCHSSHRVLPHTDPNATISPRNIAKTCMQCHSRIEGVHSQVIRGELWEKRPGAIPACTDCHLPHKVRKETVTLTISDRDCLECHERPDLVHVVEGDTLSMNAVSREQLDASIHTNIPCVKCHSDVNPRLERPCEPSGRVDCSACHAKISEEYFASGHGQDYLKGTEQAPYCTTCHGDHGVLAHYNDQSPTYRAAVPTLCGECHKEGGKAGEVRDLPNISTASSDYSTSVHGRGLTQKGLLPTAVCIDCHGSHKVLERANEESTVNPNNIAATCGVCHEGIYKQYTKSIHYAYGDDDVRFIGEHTGQWMLGVETDSTGAVIEHADVEHADVEHAGHGNGPEDLPTCATCHSSHTIKHVTGDAFMTQVTLQCGSCHEELAETYLDTMHGKAYVLGYNKAAKCSDCHGAHDIRSIDDPASTVGFRNIVETCSQCHADANMRFTGYLTHATHHDPQKYPALYYTYWAMTFLLLGVFSFFGIHTLLWLPRSFRAMRERMKERKQSQTIPRYFIRRFTRAQRLTHLFVIISFLSLAATGMTLKFSSTPWANWLADALGGVRGAGNIHRIAAVITFGYFAFHIGSLIVIKRRQRISWFKLIFGPGSLMFNLKDIKDFWGTLKWFVGAGPRPSYGRWTYWEKFDYLAVFWGVAVIGISGLMLWFPEFFTRFVPGWFLNVATIVHSRRGRYSPSDSSSPFTSSTHTCAQRPSPWTRWCSPG